MKWKLVLSCCCFGPHKSRERKERKSKQESKDGGWGKRERERDGGRGKIKTYRARPSVYCSGTILTQTGSDFNPVIFLVGSIFPLFTHHILKTQSKWESVIQPELVLFLPSAGPAHTRRWACCWRWWRYRSWPVSWRSSGTGPWRSASPWCSGGRAAGRTTNSRMAGWAGSAWACGGTGVTWQETGR